MRLWKKTALSFFFIILAFAASALVTACSLSTPTTPETTAKMTESPQFQAGKFSNIEPPAPMEISWGRVTEAMNADERAVPKGEIPVVEIPQQRLLSAPKMGLEMAWIGHATVLIEIDGKRILTDPMFSNRASPFSNVGPKRFHPTPIALEKLQGIDAVVISHNHYDHLDKETTQHLAKQGTSFFVPLGNKPQLLAWDVPEAQIIELDWWQETQLGQVKIIATPSRHYSNRSFSDYKKTLWTSWAILGPQNRVYFSGDSGYSEAFKQIGQKYGPFDASIIKIGAYGPGQSWRDVHMFPSEAMNVHKDVQGKVMLPVHWGTFNLAYHAWDEPIIRSQKEAQQAKIQLATPKIGAFFDVHGKIPSEQWWQGIE